MQLKRRDFLLLGVHAIFFSSLGAFARVPSLSGHKKGFAVLPCLDLGQLLVYDWDARKLRSISIPLTRTHGAVESVVHDGVVAVFDQYGRSAATVDIRRGKLLAHEELPEARRFYGHGVFTPDGKMLLNTEIPSDQKSPGWISLRDPRTLKKLGELPSYGYRPHDLCFLDKDIFAVTNQGRIGQASNVSFLSLQKKERLKTVEIGTEDGALSHLVASSSEEVFVSCVKGAPLETEETRELRKRTQAGGKDAEEALLRLRALISYEPAPLYLVKKDGQSTALWHKDRSVFRNNFSICALGAGRFAAAHISSGSVTIWNRGKLEKTWSFGTPTAALTLSADGSELLIAGSQGDVHFLDLVGQKRLQKWDLRLERGPVHALTLRA